jgi:collagenase-like PrtC family protease
LNDNILLNNFLSLLDESLLKSLNLLKHLPGIGISSFKLSPSMAVEWVLKFLRKSLNL